MAANLTLAQAFIKLRLEGESQVVAAVKAVNTQVSNAIKPMASLFEPAKESVLAFVKAASPQAFNTFNGSMQILSASIGKAFVPQIIEASKWIQDFAKWIRELDPETKKQIATWTGYGIVVAGAAAAFLKLNEVLKVLATNPWTIALTAGLAVMIKINAELNKMQNSMNDAISTMQRMKKGVFTEEEYKSSIAGGIEQDKTLTDDQKLEKAKKAKEEEVAEGRRVSKNMMDRNWFEAGVKDLMFNEGGDAGKVVEGRTKQVGMLDNLIDRLENKKGGPKFTDQKDLPKANGKGDFAMAGAGLGQGGGGGNITSLENAFSQTAQAALAADEIQQKLLQMAAEGNQIAREQAVDTKRVANGIERQQLP